MRILLCFVLGLSIFGCRKIGTRKIHSFPHSDAVLSSEFTFLNWNIQKGANEDFGEVIREIIETSHPDIVFFQEAKANLFPGEEMGAYFAESWQYPWPTGEIIGVLTASRVPPHSTHRIQTEGREFYITAPKVSLASVYPLSGGRELLALNVHLLNFEKGSAKWFARQLMDLAEVMEDHTGPVLWAGDFNTWNPKRLTMVLELAGELGLTEVSGFPEGRKTGDQGHGGFNKVLGVDASLPLDRVFYRGLQPIEADVLAIEASDHRPLWIRFAVNSGE